ncbi:MAG: peptidase family protein [Sphingomonas bacterium]|uniref:PDZ domain-containing protein n=1 Tax=Sphingomonas bacterium TaxID=1895847 RepID=UPI002639C7BB|nr:PDZ domain-containing protein [Sphingomonas bacterium]MDB5710395.1 peptidase family protein [Sphingomonas bacterium]
MRLLLGLVMIAMTAAATSATDDARLPDRDLLALRDLDQRVADIGYRLARAAAPFCAEHVPLSGFVLHGIEQYGAVSRDRARVTFGLGDGLAVLVVAHGSRAEAAGLRAGDAIFAVNGHAVPATTADATARVEATARAMEQGAGPMISIDIERDDRRQTITFVADRGCATQFWIDPSPRLSAEADGHEVEITSAYVERAADDAALAIVLAHELAHNILHHRARLDRDGAHHGLARYFGRSASLTRAAELEADQLSVPIAGCAGYALDDALAFREGLWRDKLADALLRAPDHPAARQRLDTIRRAIARFKADPAPCGDGAIDRR